MYGDRRLREAPASPFLRSDPAFIEAANALIAEDDLDTVRTVYLDPHFVRPEELNADEATRQLLREENPS